MNMKLRNSQPSKFRMLLKIPPSPLPQRAAAMQLPMQKRRPLMAVRCESDGETGSCSFIFNQIRNALDYAVRVLTVRGGAQVWSDASSL